MRVHEVIDERLAGGLHRLELNAHADALVVPGDAAFGVDLARRPGHTEAHFDPGAGLERARRADGDAAVAQVERRGRGNGVAEPVLDRNAQHDARAAPPIEAVGEQMRRQRRHDVLQGAELVDVAGDAESRQLPHLLGARDRPAEDEYRHSPRVELPHRSYEVHARMRWELQIEDDQIERAPAGADPGKQVAGGSRLDGFVARLFDRGAKSIAHHGVVVCDENSFGFDRGARHSRIGYTRDRSRPSGILSDRSALWPPVPSAMPKSKSTNSTSTRAIS